MIQKGENIHIHERKKGYVQDYPAKKQANNNYNGTSPRWITMVYCNCGYREALDIVYVKPE